MALVSTGILHEFVKSYGIMDLYGTLPFAWNPIKQRLEVKREKKLKFNKILLNIGYLAGSAAFLQMILFWKEASNTVRTYCMMSTSISIMGLSSTFASYRDPHLLAGLFNGMISHEKHYIREDSLKENSSKFFLRLSLKIISTSVHILLAPFVLNIFQNPCFPNYFGFWLVSACKNSLGEIPSAMEEQLPIKVFVAGVAFLNWIVFFPGLHFQCCMIVFQGFGFISIIQRYTRKVLKSSSSASQEFAKQFREIQVMAKLHRLVNADFVLLAIMVCGIFAQITALYNCIDVVKGTSQMPLQMIFNCFSIAFMSVLVFTKGYSLLANVYLAAAKSDLVIKGANVTTSAKTNRWFRKFRRSCPILKIYFGSQNFLEPVTILLIEQFVVSQTISLLLLQ